MDSIGEHIDYCNFSVSPLAIEVDVVAAVCASPNSTICIMNTNADFPDMLFEYPLDGSFVSINFEKQNWGIYFKCVAIVALKFILEDRDVIDYGNKPLWGLKASFLTGRRLQETGYPFQ